MTRIRSPYQPHIKQKPHTGRYLIEIAIYMAVIVYFMDLVIWARW